MIGIFIALLINAFLWPLKWCSSEAHFSLTRCEYFIFYFFCSMTVKEMLLAMLFEAKVFHFFIAKPCCTESKK